MSSFPDRFPHSAWTSAWSAHSDFVGSRVYACLCVTCHLYFWQDDWGLLRATGAKRTPNKSQHTTLGKNFLPPLLPGFELTTFRSRVLRSYQQAIPKRYTLIADAFFFVLKKIGSLLADNTGTEVCVVTGGHTHMTTLQGKIAALTIFCRNSTNYK